MATRRSQLCVTVVLVAIGTCLEAGVPNGWIQTDMWNISLWNTGEVSPGVPVGCDGGGPEYMSHTDWLYSHDYIREDPRAGKVWDDVAFAGLVPSGEPRARVLQGRHSRGVFPRSIPFFGNSSTSTNPAWLIGEVEMTDRASILTGRGPKIIGRFDFGRVTTTWLETRRHS